MLKYCKRVPTALEHLGWEKDQFQEEERLETDLLPTYYSKYQDWYGSLGSISKTRRHVNCTYGHARLI